MNIKLREYQKEAIASLDENNKIGIFEMATGTGKTITAIECAQKAFKEWGNRQFLVILVPYLHLLSQWEINLDELDVGGLRLEVANNRASWYKELKEDVWLFNKGLTDHVIILGSYKSYSKKECIAELKKVNDNCFLIADECHFLGSPECDVSAFKNFKGKLGLSATPRRWWDKEDTEKIFSVFKQVIFKYDIQKAIDNKYLTPYKYCPVRIDLNDGEFEEYQTLSKKISSLLVYEDDSESKQIDERLKRLLLKRTRILKKAANKLAKLKAMISEQKDKRYTLVYCSEGMIDETVKAIADLGIKVHRFNAETSISDREKILSQFANGEIEVLVAIKCLDEGVDVPATRIAYIMASTTNPREFVQRRGRILRLSKNKNQATIYDFLVLPKENYDRDRETIISVIKKEMPRFAEFAKYANNYAQASNSIRSYLKKYDLDALLDITPWQMYHKLKKEDEYIDTTERY